MNVDVGSARNRAALTTVAIDAAAEQCAIASIQPFVPNTEELDAINARGVAKRASHSRKRILTGEEQTNAGDRPPVSDPGEATAQYCIRDRWEEPGARIRACKEASGV